MIQKHCFECGTALIEKEMEEEGIVPYCPKCQQYRFPMYNVAVSMIVVDEETGKILLIQQYGKPSYILVAGYVNRGEAEEHAVVREVREETGLEVEHLRFNRTKFFEPSNTLMCNFTAFVRTAKALHINHEVDRCKWFTPQEARENIRPNSLAAEFLNAYLDEVGNKPMENLGRTALVTGASRGIGRAIALMLASRGYAVALNYAGSREAAEAVKTEIENAGGKAFTIQGDVSVSEDVDHIFKTIKTEFGGLDVLVNNAGINRDALLIRMKEENWDAVIATDLKSVFLTTKAAAAMMMRKKNGAIVNISSVVGLTGNIGQANYAAAKAGIVGFTKACAKELAARNIRVNAVAPGFIGTDMTDKIPEDLKANMLQSIPLGRMGQAEDAAKAVCFLASDEASYITGQVLNVDGGMVM